MKKKLLSMLLTVCLVAGLMPTTALAAGIENGQPALKVNQSKVAFAGHEWWVIGDGTSGVYPKSGHIALLAANRDEEFQNVPFRRGRSMSFADSSQYSGDGWYYAKNPGGMEVWTTPNEYAGSTLQQKMESIANSFSPKEQAVISARSLTGGGTCQSPSADGIAGQAVADQKLWALSEAEWNTINHADVRRYGDYWWVRSPHPGDGSLSKEGDGWGSIMTFGNVYDDDVAARPAFSLNLSSVLFTSAADESGKSSATVGGSLVGAEATTGTVKFTMKDSGMSLSVSDKSAKTAYAGESLFIAYDNATTGENQYVSCILTDNDGKIKYYGKLAQASEASAASGTVSVPLDGVNAGSYTLHIFSEQANGDQYTDFCSEPEAISLTVHDTFTITYKTNAGVEMGTLTYEVGGENALPTINEFQLNFNAFTQRAEQKGGIYVPMDGIFWYEDKEFTKPATFPDGRKGENYTMYCKLTVESMSVGSVSNRAENKSYADVGGVIQPNLGVSGYSVTGRNDGDDATKTIFEKKNADDQWVEVPEEYYTDKSGNTWPNMIYFSSVADSGTYRLKDVRYTATDNDGNILYYVDAEDTPKDEYTVKINPVELSITGVTAQDRNCDGTDTVRLTGGTLQGVLYNDDVSFTLGTGKLSDKTAGSGKLVTTNIALTGADSGNYTLKQPDNVTVTISDDWDGPVWNWSDDGKSATVTFTCKGDNTHTQSPDVTITSTVKTPATCTEKGTTTYTAKVTFDGQEYTSTKDVEDIVPTDHDWGEPVWNWSDDGKTAAVTFTCQNDSTHTQSPDVTITSTVKTSATCTEKGTTTYTAKVTFDGQEYTSTKDVEDIVPTDHDWGEPVWNWSDDGKTAAVTFTCQNDSTHTQSPAVIITSTVKTPATCTEKGITTYTAKVTFNGQEYTSTKDVVDIAKLSHTLKKTDKVEATCTKDGKEAYYTCEVCQKHFSDEEGNNEITKFEEYGIIPATEHKAGTEWKHNDTSHWNECMNNCGEKLNEAAHSFEWVVDKEATATELGSKHEECSICGYENAAVEIPATGTTEPTDPSEPTDPDKENPDTGSTSPQTGDNSNMALWIALFLASGGALTVVTIYSRKRRKTE